LTIEITTKIAKITKRNKEDPTVPKLRPPFSVGFIKKSPKVAPNGRVKTNEDQNKITLEIVVKK
jgi:hypothetical protein